MSYAIRILIGAVALVIVAGATAYRHTTATAQVPTATTGTRDSSSSFDSTINQNAQRMLEEGRRTFVSIHSALKTSGAAGCGCTKRSWGKSSAVSGPV